ncbi:MAG: YdiU family protein [Granulosicoccus sp.]
MIAFDNSYSQLPVACFERVSPTPVKSPALIKLNEPLAIQLGLDPQWLASDEGIAMLSGNSVLESSEALAMAYAGHQFGNWVPQLGDGRAILLGELLDNNDERYDIQLKGAGRTPFSRGGDGRNWIGPVLREYLVSESMAALGVPTTRALAAVSTGEHVLRENGPLPGAIVTRVARSHIRVGTFQYFAARGDNEALQALVDYVIARHFPHLADADNKALSLLEAVIDVQASLIAHWQSVGFIHGVMNTDNCSVSGHTIDYGPCAFMDSYQADKVFSSIDRGARYAYQNQPRIAQWNLVNLAQCLLPFMHENSEEAVAVAQDAINRFDEIFVSYYLQRMRAKLGLEDEEEDDLALASHLLQQMEQQQLDFTITFTQLSYHDATSPFAAGGSLYDWHLRWQKRLDNDPSRQQQSRERMRGVNPTVIPRNHLIEAFIERAVKDNDFGEFHSMLAVVTTPFEPDHCDSIYARAPAPDEEVTQTFCGT